MEVVGFLVSAAVGLIPALFYGGFVIWLDRHEKEPWWLLLLSFLWGAIPAVAIALVAQILLDIPTTWVFAQESLAYEIMGSSIWAPITEEIAKGMGIILILLVARREIDSVLDGIIYGALAGLGFAFSEDILYFTSALAEEGWGSWVTVVLLRTIPFGLNHALFTGLTGAGVAAAYLNRNRLIKLVSPPIGLVVGMGFHSIHNLGASLTGESCTPICFSFLFDWGGILILGVLVVLVWRQEKRWITANLAGEVNERVLESLTIWQRWQSVRWSALLRADLTSWRRWGRIRQHATELAFKKQRKVEGSTVPGLEKDIARHRRVLAALGVALPVDPSLGQ
jgi:RsiW-degrading membrane proteinase PrsW (M82 family)